MKCQICGNESGKYPLCYECNIRKQRGDVIKCTDCGKWHFTNKPCEACVMKTKSDFIYELKNSLLSPIEKKYYECIKTVLPEDYVIYPQINLASIIKRTDAHTFQNELFRNMDFGVFDKNYKPVFLIEIQDKSHLNSERHKRDEKIRLICEEAGVAIVEFWETQNIDQEKVKTKIIEALEAEPVKRKANHKSKEKETVEVFENPDNKHIDFWKASRLILTVLSIMAFYFAENMYEETGKKYQCFICALFPVVTSVLGLVTLKKERKITAALIVGILFSLVLLAFPFIYK